MESFALCAFGLCFRCLCRGFKWFRGCGVFFDRLILFLFLSLVMAILLWLTQNTVEAAPLSTFFECLNSILVLGVGQVSSENWEAKLRFCILLFVSYRSRGNTTQHNTIQNFSLIWFTHDFGSSALSPTNSFLFYICLRWRGGLCFVVFCFYFNH